MIQMISVKIVKIQIFELTRKTLIANVLIVKLLRVTNKVKKVEDSSKAANFHLKIPHSGKKGQFNSFCCSSYLFVSLAVSYIKTSVPYFPLISDPDAYLISKL